MIDEELRGEATWLRLDDLCKRDPVWAQQRLKLTAALLELAAAEIERLRADAARYRWLRTAGAWESEIGMDALSEDPAKFDAAVDAAMKE